MRPWQERTCLLTGESNLELLQNATVAVIGLGGVGGYATEMLARAGVGHLILIDSDSVNLSNKNRQLIALDSTIGRHKTEVMNERLHDINQELKIETITQFISEENIATLLEPYKIDFLVDAIDTLAPKLALIKYCMDNEIPLVSSMGAGAKYDATKVRIADLSKSYNCPLAYIVRKKLRKMGIEKGFKVVFSEELPRRESIVEVNEQNKKSQTGTISYLPAVFGCACAQAAVEHLIVK
ncbi:MAG: tRNA threonylcarbamoyladenosine dehydratase [Bacteroidales bacterium]|nr:tRNA threonylcarbamoyladenosine dehydratase [Bacteroidales bacterium]